MKLNKCVVVFIAVVDSLVVVVGVVSLMVCGSYEAECKRVRSEGERIFNSEE